MAKTAKKKARAGRAPQQAPATREGRGAAALLKGAIKGAKTQQAHPGSGKRVK